MELNTISGLAIAGVICSIVLSMGVPIALFIAGRVKLIYSAARTVHSVLQAKCRVPWKMPKTRMAL